MSRLPEQEPERRDPGDSKNSSRQMYALVGVGFEFACIVGLLALLGWYLDSRWRTTPWLLIAGIGVGFAAGLWQLIRAGRRSFKD